MPPLWVVRAGYRPLWHVLATLPLLITLLSQPSRWLHWAVLPLLALTAWGASKRRVVLRRPLCPLHQRDRTIERRRRLGALTFLPGFIPVAPYVPWDYAGEILTLIWLLVLVVMAILETQIFMTVSMRRLDRTTLYVAGLGAAFLGSLPERGEQRQAMSLLAAPGSMPRVRWHKPGRTVRRQ